MVKCEKCGSSGNISRHHVLPKRYFKRKNREFVYLCAVCHREIERMIACRESGEAQGFGLKRLMLAAGAYRDLLGRFFGFADYDEYLELRHSEAQIEYL